MKTIKTLTLLFLLLAVVGGISFLPDQSMGGDRDQMKERDLVPDKTPYDPILLAQQSAGGNEAVPPAYRERRSIASKNPTTDEAAGSEPLKLGLREFIRLVREKNEQILFQDSEWAISREAIQSAKAIFEPELVSSYQHDDSSKKNTVRDIVSLNFSSAVFDEKSDDYQTAVEILAPSGGRVRLGYNLRAFHNTIDRQYGVNREYESFLGVNLTQPLLKGGGVQATMAGIQVAEADADIAFQSYREQMMRVVSQAIAAYWDLYLAQEKYKVRKDSEHIAEEILRDNLARVKTGKMAETEVLEARAGLALRKSLVTEARQVMVSTMNNMRSLFSSSAAETEAGVEAADRLDIEVVETDFYDSLLKALKLRPEYISSRKKIEREVIRLIFAKNQRWPQLDLKGSYGLNGLADSFNNSWDDVSAHDFKTWSIGVELRIPLGGGRKSRSELEASKQRKRQALLELKAVEVAVANGVDTAIQNVHSALEQSRNYASAVDMNKRLLEAEIARFRAGKSSSRDLLEREEDLNKAKEAELESLVRYKKALLQLDLSEGSLLSKHRIEVMEVDL